MKSIMIRTNVEKANLLISLHPEQREKLVSYFEESAKNLVEFQEEYRKSWNNDFVKFDWWLKVASDVLKVIERKKVRLHSSNTAFANELFIDLGAIFCNDCIIKYAKENPQNNAFNLIVAALICTPNMYHFEFKN